jgi:hypothetical protein
MILEEEDFLEIYKPIKNHLDSNARFEGTMFETYKEELEFVKNHENKNQVWTLVYGNNGLDRYIIPGFHFVNRDGYFITEKEWDKETQDINLNDLVTRDQAMDAAVRFCNKMGCYFEDESLTDFFITEL